jgi:hypothetical protein
MRTSLFKYKNNSYYMNWYMNSYTVYYANSANW